MQVRSAAAFSALSIWLSRLCRCLSYSMLVAFLLGTRAGASRWRLVWPSDRSDWPPAFVAFVALALRLGARGEALRSGATLLRLPIYVLWKLPIYLGLARRGAPKEWLRTGR